METNYWRSHYVEHLKSQIDQLRETKIAGTQENALDQGGSGRLGKTNGFRSPDGRYEAVKVGIGVDTSWFNAGKKLIP